MKYGLLILALVASIAHASTASIGTAAPALTKVQSALVNTGALVSAGLVAGSTYCFAVTAVVNGVESAQSNTGCGSIPLPTPNAPSQITVIIH